MKASDLSIIIPTHGRPDILVRTLDSLADQTVRGFEVIVVVDGRDQPVPDRTDVRVLVQDHAGPGAARNRGASSCSRPLLLFLGDDMIPVPSLVESHIRAHGRFPDPLDAVLGHVNWHPDVRRNHVLRWLDWSTAQFDYSQLSGLSGADVGPTRFYSCNVSLKRELFAQVGGFDEDFVFYYEDLDAGHRLGVAGMRLRYERTALVHHLHDYDLAGIERRFRGIALGERLMTAKHRWFQPWFHQRITDAMRRDTVSGFWARIVDVVPRRLWGRRRVERRADRWYYQQIGPAFLAAWDEAAEVDELARYLGDEFVGTWVAHPSRCDDTDAGYLHRVAAAALPGLDPQKVDSIMAANPDPDTTVLDDRDDSGALGLELLGRGRAVKFLRTDPALAAYVRWRLDHRGLVAEVHETAPDRTGDSDVEPT